MSTSFGVRSSMRSAAARRIEAAGRAFQAAQQGSTSDEEASGAAMRPEPPRNTASMPPPPENAPRILFRTPIEPTRPAAARRDAGKGQCRAIIEEVAAKYQVPVKDILSDRRAHVLIPPRHEAMFRCVNESMLSLPAIGRIFNRDHTSIGHAVMRHHLRRRSAAARHGLEIRTPETAMTAVPFMQLYVADYLGDTQHLTTEQHGAYLLLLMAMWRAGGSLPDDATQIARIVRMTPTRWRKTSPIVLAFFDRAGGRIEQKRLTKEIAKASDISRKRASAGARGGAVNALKHKGFGASFRTGAGAGAEANASPLPAHNQIQENDLTTSRANALPADEALLAALAAAGGDALRLEALANLAEPRAWLAAGCDLDADILPVIAMRCRTHLPDSIHAWSYFTAAIFEARERRLAHPLGTASHDRKARRQSPHDALAAGMARALGAGGDGADRRDADAAAGAGTDGGATALAPRGGGAASGLDRSGGK